MPAATTYNQPFAEKEFRTIKLLRAILGVLISLGFLLAFSIWYNFGLTISFLITLGTSLFFGLMLLLVKLGHPYLSRLLVCIFLPLYTLAAAVLIKATELTPIQESEYFDSRLILLVSVVLPLVLFSLQEKKALYSCLTLSFLCLFLYDPVHRLFGVGFYQVGLRSPNYPFISFIVIIMFLLLSSAILYFKVLLERKETQLIERNQALEESHDEISAQAASLQRKQEELAEANALIFQQKLMLEQENDELYQSLVEKNEMLRNSNEQLNRQVKALRQFNYTISHNLRGPVASLLGIISLFDRNTPDAHNREMIGFAEQAATSLDKVLRDLSNLLQQNTEAPELEATDLPEMIGQAWQSLRREYAADEDALQLCLEVKEVESLKPYLYSVIYNLLSNSLKYRRAEEPLQLRISSRWENKGFMLEVADNGLGIDLEKYGRDLFKMYRRFNTEQDGRGLGLFLVKSQVEEMGGSIEVSSLPGQGTTFRIWLPQSEQL